MPDHDEPGGGSAPTVAGAMNGSTTSCSGNRPNATHATAATAAGATTLNPVAVEGAGARVRAGDGLRR